MVLFLADKTSLNILDIFILAEVLTEEWTRDDGNPIFIITHLFICNNSLVFLPAILIQFPLDITSLSSSFTKFKVLFISTSTLTNCCLSKATLFKMEQWSVKLRNG